LTENFNSFFKHLNPKQSFVEIAASEHSTITGLIEDRRGPAAELSPTCFSQGSYKQDTAIYSINDVDIVALCNLWQPGSGGGNGWSRDEIFATVAAPLLNDRRYRDKVQYGPQSMCVKVDLGIAIEILPVVYAAGTTDAAKEPFRLYRPETQKWEDGYARYHQAYLTQKNRADRTGGNFIPAIKVLKHLRSRRGLDAVSFHLECLLHAVPDSVFGGGPADYICNVLSYLAATNAPAWYQGGVMTPCGERNIFTAREWAAQSWTTFHQHIGLWASSSQAAVLAPSKAAAIQAWQLALGDDFFPG
jgi:Second Messenger Oligonucleotide or Dinucleotide Synthetase domain